MIFFTVAGQTQGCRDYWVRFHRAKLLLQQWKIGRFKFRSHNHIQGFFHFLILQLCIVHFLKLKQWAIKLRWSAIWTPFRIRAGETGAVPWAHSHAVGRRLERTLARAQMLRWGLGSGRTLCNFYFLLHFRGVWLELEGRWRNRRKLNILTASREFTTCFDKVALGSWALCLFFDADGCVHEVLKPARPFNSRVLPINTLHHLFESSLDVLGPAQFVLHRK